MQFEEVEILYLSEKDVELTGLGVKETIEIIKKVFRAHGQGNAIVPAKITLDMSITGKYSSSGNAMPAYVGSLKIAGIKWVGTNWSNPQRHNLPSLFATIILTDPTTFASVAIIGGRWITAMRTGAVTAVATNYLARKNSEIVCILGAGYQGKHQLLALNEVLKIKEVRIADIIREAREKYAEEMSQKLGLIVKPAEDIKEAVKGADVIVAATTADKPLVKYEWIKKGCFICAIGSYQELDYRVTKSMNKIVVDHLKQTMHRGELSKWFAKGLLSERDVYAELGDIVAGKKPGRESDIENILCVPIGMGSEDVAAAYRVYQLAKEKGVGQKLRWL